MAENPAHANDSAMLLQTASLDTEPSEGSLLQPKPTRAAVVRARGILAGQIVASCFVGLTLGLLVFGHPFSRSPASPDSPKAADPLTKFLVVGDWGRLGKYDQKQVANLMGDKAAALKPEFVISTGDNFYPSGLTSVDDPAFATSFTDVYSADSLQVPWYSVLGNHDYSDGRSASDQPQGCGSGVQDCYFSPLHQLDYKLVQRDSRWRCQRAYQLSLAGGKIDFFFFDTCPFVQRYMSTIWANTPGGLGEQSWEANLKELKAALHRSTADWKIVVGHHPVYSNGHHNSTIELIQNLDPELTANNVQAYLCGHDHNLEYIRVPGAPTHHIISGGGSKSDRPFIDNVNSLFQHEASGYASIEVHADRMDVEFLGIEDLTPLYTFTIPRV